MQKCALNGTLKAKRKFGRKIPRKSEEPVNCKPANRFADKRNKRLLQDGVCAKAQTPKTIGKADCQSSK